MKTTEYGATEINNLLTSVRAYDTTIGAYEKHFILKDNGIYSIKLTNGTLSLYPEELMDKQAIPQERFKDIAARFREPGMKNNMR
jgi:hypothetical protein